MIALTGTPGTGKTSVAEELRRRGHDVLDLKSYIADSGLRGEYIEEMDTYDVDTDLLRESLRGSDHEIAEGHLSHFLDADMCIVMRCHPDVLAQRLRDRGYAEGKVRENVEAELLDVILCEAVDSGVPVFAVDTTSSTASLAADAVEAIMRGETDGRLPGDVSWAEEMDRWF